MGEPSSSPESPSARNNLVVELGPDGKPKYRGSGKDLSYFRRGDEGAFCAARHRTVGRRRSRDAGVLVRGVSRGGVKGEQRVVLRLHPRVAPYKAAIFPLVNKDGMPEIAQKIYRDLKQSFNVYYDDKGAVGRRYRRQDEAGTPYCLTIDGQTLTDQTVNDS